MTDAVSVAAQTQLVALDTAWGDPPRIARGAGAPVLSVDGFEGPLDWLLEMVRAHKIDLARLSILALIEAFGSAFETALQAEDRLSALSMARWSDWLVMATALAELRSQLMLPGEQLKAQDPQLLVESLRSHLLSRADVAAAADWLEQRPQLGREVFIRGRTEPGVTAPMRGGDVTELLRACLVALRVADAPDRYTLPPRTLWPVVETIARMETLLLSVPVGSALTAYLPAISDADRNNLRTRAAVASTLLAGLELARDGRLTLDQRDPWQPIYVRHGVAREEELTAAESPALTGGSVSNGSSE